MLATDLRTIRKQSRLYQGPVARAAGIHEATLIDIENGRCGIDPETYRKIINAIETLGPRQEEQKGLAVA